MRLQLTAGATGTYGNARNVAFNLAALFNLRLGAHGFLAELGWIYGLAAARTGIAPLPNEFGDAEENANEMAETAVRMVLGWVKQKLPAGIAPHLDTLMGGGDLGSIASSALGGLFGKDD